MYRHIFVSFKPRWLTKYNILRLIAVPLALNFIHFEEDIVHLHGDDWFYFWRTRPTVRTMHGSALLESRTATSAKRRWSQRGIYLLEQLSARLATVCVAVSPHTLAIYRGAKVVNNGVDGSVFFPGQKAVRPRVLFVGTWNGRKRGQFIFEAFTSVIKARLPAAELYMVCDYCPAAPGVVHVTTPNDQILAELYRSAWVFAYPSLYEGFGVAYLEAMASGTAIVTSPNPGAKFVLRGGELGQIVDDSSFAAAVVELLTSGSERQRWEQTGMGAVKQFSWDQIADAHYNIYKELAMKRLKPADS